MRGTKRLLWLCFILAFSALAQQRFEWKDTGDGHMELREGGKAALVYNYGPQLKQGAPENRRRCCYFFPVYTPAGVSQLEDFPTDHWHHRGLFWSWPIVETGGKQYDIWMNFTAKPRSAKLPTVSANAKEARMEAHNFWEADGKDIVKEDVVLTVFPTQGNAREMEVDLTWEALNAPVTLQGSPDGLKSYGGFSARFAPRENTVLRADGQVLQQDQDRNAYKWVEMEGVYDGKHAALRITPDEKNIQTPYQWCLRQSVVGSMKIGDRRYGFIGASFPGRTNNVDRFTLEPGKPLNLRFRVRLADLP